MLVCDEHKFIFLRNPKTASRSVTRALSENFNVRQVGVYHDWKIPKELVGYFVFVVVRNPYTRAVSGWKHWYGGGWTDFGEWTQELAKTPIILGNWHTTIDQAVIVTKGRHWKRQTEILDKFGDDIHIIRYENLAAFLRA